MFWTQQENESEADDLKWATYRDCEGLIYTPSEAPLLLLIDAPVPQILPHLLGDTHTN